MGECERDRALLSVLKPEDRATLEEFVDQFVGEELPEVNRETLWCAADLFEDAGVRKPPLEGIAGLLMAAILRERAAAATP